MADEVPARSQGGLGSQILAGAAWMVAMRWAMRGIGLVNTLILVRLLTPADFGVVAMAMVVVAFVRAFDQLGLDLALIRMDDPTEVHYRTAWTLSVALGAATGLVLYLVAPLVATFYEEPRLVPVMYVLAALPLLSGLDNPRLVEFRRDLQFSRDFRYSVTCRLLGLPVTIGLALYFRDYRALVAGMLAQQAIQLLVGYAMRPWMPGFHLGAIKELGGFAVWVQVRNVGAALAARIDQLFVGKLLGAADLGGYHVSREITQFATSEVVMPIGRALVPGYSKVQHDRARFASAFEKLLGLYAMMSFALAGGLYAVAPDLVPIALGAQWTPFVEMFQVLAIAGGIAALSGATGPPLVVAGRIRLLALAMWVELALAVVALSIVAVVSESAVAVALARAAVCLAMFLLLLGLAMSQFDVAGRSVLGALLRPCVSTGLMVAVVVAFVETSDLAPSFRLPAAVLIGVAVQTGATWLTWVASGRPEGAESEVLSRVATFLQSRRAGPVGTAGTGES